MTVEESTEIPGLTPIRANGDLAAVRGQNVDTAI